MTAVDEAPAGSAVEPATAGSEVPDDMSGGAKAQGSRRVRARAARARAAGSYLLALLKGWWARRRTPTDAERTAPSIRRDSIWRQPLPTIAALVVHTRSGAWAPGDWPRPVEAAGRAYGYAVAIPGSLLLYGTAWTIQRPSRLLGVLVFVALLAVSL